jgi:hypothetical protein
VLINCRAFEAVLRRLRPPMTPPPNRLRARRRPPNTTIGGAAGISGPGQPNRGVVFMIVVLFSNRLPARIPGFSAGQLRRTAGAVDTPKGHAVRGRVPGDVEINGFAALPRKLRFWY